jgi:RHS repeat-associated protein
MDAAERETRWNYDEYGRVTNKVDHLGNVLFIYKYDANGRLTNRWTPVKGHTGYAYDAVGNLTNVNYAASPDLSFRYDVLNRVTNMVDAAGVTRYTYGVAGDLTSEDGPWTGDTVSATQTNGLRASLAVAADAGVPPQAWAYGYDSMSRLRAMSSPAGSFSQSYWLDKPTRLVGGIGLPTGGYRTNNYTALGLLTLTALKSSTGTTLDSYGYSRDSGGPQPIRLTRNVDGSTVDYSYDNALQLTGATGKEGGGANRRHEQFAYDYDAAGNLIARTASWLEEGFSVNNLNQITARTRIGSNVVAGVVEGSPTSVSVNSEAATIYADNTFSWLGYDVLDDEDYVGSFTAQAQDAAGRTATHTISVNLPAYLSYQYDLNGNLLTDGRRHFTYDDENQLTQVVVTNLTKSEFVYDGKMRRRVRKESVWSGQWQQVLEVHYLYDGNLVVQERHYDGAAPTAYPQRLVTYTRGTDLSGGRQGAGGIGGLLAWSEYTGQDARLSTAFYHNDMVGNVTLLAGTNQEVVARYLYEPFGRLIAMTGPLAEANTHRSSSKEAHEPSGLVYYLYRYYEPGLQRWANRDPIFELGGINLYKFTRNRPTDAFDAFGLCDCAQMQKDIQNFRAAREKLENMFMRYEPGQSFRDYGLGVAATTGGYRSPNFSTYDTCTQEAINNIEGDSAFTTAATLYQSMVGAVGYYTFGLHGLFNGTSAAEQWGLTYIRIELTRNQLLLNKLSDRYGSECSCSSGQNVVPFELPQIKPPITVK